VTLLLAGERGGFSVEQILFLEYRYLQAPKKRIDLGRRTVYFSMSVAVAEASGLEGAGRLRYKFGSPEYWLAFCFKPGRGER
jgi:hypothetical protein